jgi:hypothetical protein
MPANPAPSAPTAMKPSGIRLIPTPYWFDSAWRGGKPRMLRIELPASVDGKTEFFIPVEPGFAALKRAYTTAKAFYWVSTHGGVT